MTGVNEISINNALNAPLCYLKLSLTSNTIIPDTNELKIYVTKDADIKKTYSFNLSNPLSINDKTNAFLSIEKFISHKNI